MLFNFKSFENKQRYTYFPVFKKKYIKEYKLSTNKANL